MYTVIYGAQAIALSTLKAVEKLYPQKRVLSFWVSEIENNPSFLGGLPVKDFGKAVCNMKEQEKGNTEVFICTPENVMDSIEHSIEEAGFQNYSRVDSIRWAGLQERFFADSNVFIPLSRFLCGEKMPRLQLFQMVNHHDSEIKMSYSYPDYVSKLQVGAFFSDKKIADMQDNSFDNISEKNRNYSELSGLYWIWKNVICSENAECDYYGLCHYRRIFDFSKEDLLRIGSNEIDVILPYPMPYEPNIEAHHERYLSKEEWDAVMKALSELHPNDLGRFSEILEQGYMFNYNIIIAKKKVLDEYCQWLFPILFRVEEICDPLYEKAPNRYIGYVAETLETLYFMTKKSEIKIAHTGVRMLV